MSRNAWADAWETALRTAVSDETTLLAGHNDLVAGGITHLAITPGKATAMATARHSNEEAHTVITLPVLTHEQATIVRAASSHCGHHKELRAGGLPDCLADPAHTGNVPVAPAFTEIGFACTCGTSPCRHAAALAHAVTRRLITNPAEFAVIRGLPLQKPTTETADAAPDPEAITTRTAPRGKRQVPAHHVWSWYRECAELPPVPDHTSDPVDLPTPAPPSWPPLPAPAPGQEQLHALVNDAAEQARNHLLSGTALECAWNDDAIRLASTIPQARLPEIADRLGLDIAQLRERLTMKRT
ncbi:hypothetical protein [Streptomyces sp. 4F14]|uniref:hypothetical protein n=1 Tax=Streptomyces sp. 4F14 TaxID=3394380 RepID=UPI003A8B5699